MNNLDKLIDIRAIVSRALEEYCDTGSQAEEDALAATLEDVAGIVGQGAKRHWLEMDGLGVMRLHAGNVTKFVGAHKCPEYPAGGSIIEARCVRNPDGSGVRITIETNGLEELTAYSRCGLRKAERFAVGALHGLCGYRRSNRRNGGKEADND